MFYNIFFITHKALPPVAKSCGRRKIREINILISEESKTLNQRARDIFIETPKLELDVGKAEEETSGVLT